MASDQTNKLTIEKLLSKIHPFNEFLGISPACCYVRLLGDDGSDMLNGVRSNKQSIGKLKDIQFWENCSQSVSQYH